MLGKIQRVKAGDSSVNRCPRCSGVALRQVGDPRLHPEMGIEFRRRLCQNDGCDWVGMEMRAILTPALAAVIEEAIQEHRSIEAEKSYEEE